MHLPTSTVNCTLNALLLGCEGIAGSTSMMIDAGNTTPPSSDADSTIIIRGRSFAAVPTFLFISVGIILILCMLVCAIRERVEVHPDTANGGHGEIGNIDRHNDPSTATKQQLDASVRRRIVTAIFARQDVLPTAVSRRGKMQESDVELGCNDDNENRIDSSGEMRNEAPDERDFGVDDDDVSGELERRQESICAICLDKLTNADKVSSTACSHAFHQDCIIDWSKAKSECPICRQDMWDPELFSKLAEKESAEKMSTQER